MKTVRVMFRVQGPDTKRIGRIDPKRVDATTESAIAKHQAQDEANAMLECSQVC